MGQAASTSTHHERASKHANNEHLRPSSEIPGSPWFFRAINRHDNANSLIHCKTATTTSLTGPFRRGRRLESTEEGAGIPIKSAKAKQVKTNSFSFSFNLFNLKHIL